MMTVVKKGGRTLKSLGGSWEGLKQQLREFQEATGRDSEAVRRASEDAGNKMELVP